jgi:hypothetical protein
MSFITYENAKGVYYRLSGKASPIAMLVAAGIALLLAYRTAAVDYLEVIPPTTSSDEPPAAV